MNETPCLIIDDGMRQFLACPMVAKLCFIREEGEVVRPGQIIARAMRLGIAYDLVSPVQQTIVLTKQHTATQNAEYLTKLFEYSLGEGSGSVKVFEKLSPNTNTFLSPMDGMFYLSSSPSAPPFIRIQEEIMPNATVGIIEVMKCFYPVVYTGTRKIIITKIDVVGASPVSLGQVLFHFDEVQ